MLLLPTLFANSSTAFSGPNASAVQMYVSNEGSEVVSVIQGTRVIANVSVTGGGCCKMAYDPTNKKLFVPLNDEYVAVIDVTTNKVIDTINLGEDAANVAQYVPSNGEVYVAGTEYYPCLNVINASNDRVIGCIGLDHSGRWPISLGYSPANDELYVGSQGQNSESRLLFVINPMTNKIVKIIKLPALYPASMEFDPANTDMYVVSCRYGVAVYNSKNKLVANITDVGLSCVNQELAYNPVNQDMYLTAGHSLTTVYLISSTNNTVIGAIKGFSSPEGIAYDPSDRLMYVVNNGNGTVQTISGTVVENTIVLGTNSPNDIVGA